LREGSGILNWLIEGVRWWFAEGLILPPEVSSATEEYRSERTYWGILSRVLHTGAGVFRAGAGTVQGVSGMVRGKQRTRLQRAVFSLRLKEMGYEKTRTAEARYWSGIALRVKQA
jgi:putative DNA primase/helicase